jgi:pimeloyl-ACP methyl ester carboxylesterase
MATVEINGAKFGYDEAGSGPAVVLVHAGLADRRMWGHQFEVLARDHRVIRYDWRGYGDSDEAAGDVAHHEDLLALMDALDVDSAALVGCSYGGAHAIDVALLAPERVTHLALIASWLHGHPFPPHMLAEFGRFPTGIPKERLDGYNGRTAEHVDRADIAAMAENNVRVMVVGPDRERSAIDAGVLEEALDMARGVFSRMWNGPLSTDRHLQPAAVGRLQEIDVPTLVINGLVDVNGVQEVADMFTDPGGIKNARRLDLADTGHLPPLERPREVTEALVSLLQEPR